MFIKKNIYGNEIKFIDEETIHTYPDDLTNMFRWIQKNFNLDNSVIFDVGANIGIFTVCLKQMFSNLKIFSFEPIKNNFELLKKNVESNDMMNIVDCHNIGFGYKNENFLLSIPNKDQQKYRFSQKNPNNSGLFSVLGRGEKKENCQFVTIDSFVEFKQLTRIDFIKIDVEGFEYQVLKGAIKTIKKLSPTIFFECNQYTRSLWETSLPNSTTQKSFLFPKININIHEFYDFINSFDYNIYGLNYGWQTKLVPLNNFNNIEDISDIILTRDKLH